MCVPGEDDSLGFQVVFQTLLYLIQKSVVVLKSLQKICVEQKHMHVWSSVFLSPHIHVFLSIFPSMLYG